MRNVISWKHPLQTQESIHKTVEIYSIMDRIITSLIIIKTFLIQQAGICNGGLETRQIDHILPICSTIESEPESESELFYSANIQHAITMVMCKNKNKSLMLAWRLLLRPITGRYHRATRRNKKTGSQVVASVIMNTDLT